MERYYHEKLIVTIGGESGVGKTEIVSLIQEELWNKHKIRAKMIHIDDYYFTSWQDRNEIRKNKGVRSVGIKEIDWIKLENIAKTFRTNNKKLYVQRIHKYTNSIEYVIANNRAIDILFIEGLYANYLKQKDLGIYLAGSYKDTIKFRKERGKEIINAFRKKVLAKERTEVLKTKKGAKIIIPFKVKEKK